MNILDYHKESKSRPDLVRPKLALGTLYGVMAGLAFAGACWAMDALLLSQAHAYFPWIKLILGSLLCGLAGGVTGWLTVRLERGLLGLLFWLAATGFFSWITVALPLNIYPFIASRLEPELAGLLDYQMKSEFPTRFWVAFGWIVIFTLITGIVQVPLVEPAVFSTSLFSKAAPILFCVVIMGVNGSMADGLDNKPLRNAVLAMDHTIQFVLDNRGQSVDPATSRHWHASSLRSVQDQISQTRRLIVSEYDEYLGEIHLVVRFEDLWVECTTVYGQPSFCKSIQAGP
jgi:hypothetical protein